MFHIRLGSSLIPAFSKTSFRSSPLLAAACLSWAVNCSGSRELEVEFDRSDSASEAERHADDDAPKEQVRALQDAWVQTLFAE